MRLRERKRQCPGKEWGTGTRRTTDARDEGLGQERKRERAGATDICACVRWPWLRP